MALDKAIPVDFDKESERVIIYDVDSKSYEAVINEFPILIGTFTNIPNFAFKVWCLMGTSMKGVVPTLIMDGREISSLSLAY